MFNNGDVIPKHEFITLYPGTVYRPSDALFFQSIGNPYIFRCSDGIMVDGNNRGISRSLHKSLVSRHGPKARDVSWLGLSSSLAIGQIINNGGSEKCNVAYQELDFFDHTELDRKHIQVSFCKFSLLFFAHIYNMEVKSSFQNGEFFLRLLANCPGNDQILNLNFLMTKL